MRDLHRCRWASIGVVVVSDGVVWLDIGTSSVEGIWTEQGCVRGTHRRDGDARQPRWGGAHPCQTGERGGAQNRKDLSGRRPNRRPTNQVRWRAGFGRNPHIREEFGACDVPGIMPPHRRPRPHVLQR